jgi:hypothetical protein
MADRVLRGSRLGAVSYESDRHIEPAPRKTVEYVCPKGHRFSVPLAAEAEVPAGWECRSCGSAAVLAGGAPPAPTKTRPTRSHMDMLRERRSTADLEAVLREQLEERKRKSA